MLLRNMLARAPSGELIAGTPYAGFLAAQIISETATGDHGAGLLYNEALSQTGRQLRVKITSYTGTPGKLFVFENGSVLIEGEADGAYSIGYDWEAWADDGSLIASSDTASVTIGPLAASAPGGEGVSTGSGSGGEATGQIAGSAPGGEGVSTGSGSGGEATGGSGTDASAPGGEGIGTGSGSGGEATGGSGGSVSGSLTDEDISRIVAALTPAIIAALNATAVPVNAIQMNGYAIIGNGSEADPWRGQGVSP